MEKNLELSQDFVVQLKPNRLFIKAIGDVSGGQTQVYYRLIYDHYENEPEQVPTEQEDGSIIMQDSQEENLVLKYSITLFESNETIPTEYWIPLLMGDTATINQILAGFTWYGPFEGLVLQVK